ncbi:type II toxin-antitoxin system RelE/ParE family toxin [Mucilaginibacter aquariorum]|uniref:Type II toxin-antitoxin system RelE/ParE family toxin n=1 Tax=Mucilaginibacter aquariorum TaxID=2967225 RepID=A0ABT1T1V0_9SPHI|nr:type II toxin-antitoxin system RelE/ParE family toxin [Mucilaginibacter aquariorum]
MFTVKLLLKAEIDFSDACQWYENKQPGLGKRFYKAVNAKLDLNGKTPLHYNVRFSEKYRFALIDNFPYLISYRVDEDVKFVYIISIFHTSQNSEVF